MGLPKATRILPLSQAGRSEHLNKVRALLGRKKKRRAFEQATHTIKWPQLFSKPCVRKLLSKVPPSLFRTMAHAQSLEKMKAGGVPLGSSRPSIINNGLGLEPWSLHILFKSLGSRVHEDSSRGRKQFKVPRKGWKNLKKTFREKVGSSWPSWCWAGLPHHLINRS